MRIAVETLDDALLQLYPELLGRETNVAASRGCNTEIIGVLIEIAKPRARLSRSETRGRLFSSLGELLWYLTGDNRLDFIEPYIQRYQDESEDGVTVYGGYGRRMFQRRGQNQVRNVIALLRARPSTRRAVVQLFDADDIAAEHREVPCTTTLQFLIRADRLHLVVTMRSNDAFIGLPHDVFCFTMLQEIVARTVNCEIGSYRHFVGSMHLYDENRTNASNLVEEGFQSRIEMPAMPLGDPWPALNSILDTESRIRRGERVDANSLGLDGYWSDLVRLLQIFHAKDDAYKEALRKDMSFDRYKSYITMRTGRAVTYSS